MEDFRKFQRALLKMYDDEAESSLAIDAADLTATAQEVLRQEMLQQHGLGEPTGGNQGTHDS